MVVVTLPSILRRLESMTAIRPRAAHSAKGSRKRGAVGSNSTSADSNWESSGVLDLGTAGLLGLLPEDLGHLAGDLGGTGEDDGAVAGLEDTGVLLDDDHGGEGLDGLADTLGLLVDDVTGEIFSSLVTPLMDIPTELPGPADSRTFLCCSMENIFLPVRPAGVMPMTSPGLRVPCSMVPAMI